MGYAKHFSMFIKRKKNRSDTVSIVVAEKISGYYKELTTIGIARHQEEIDSLISKGRKWIDAEQERRHPRLDLFGEERKKCEAELLSAEQKLSCITNISINGADLILDRVFDCIIRSIPTQSFGSTAFRSIGTQFTTCIFYICASILIDNKLGQNLIVSM